jgi:hypothetical protein
MLTTLPDAPGPRVNLQTMTNSLVLFKLDEQIKNRCDLAWVSEVHRTRTIVFLHKGDL